MEACYETLSAIYEIVKSDSSPHTYLCTPHQIILRQSGDWLVIQKHLEVLAAEKLITIKQLDKIAITITAEGIVKAKAARNNFVNDSFTFHNEVKPLSTSKLKPY